MLCVRNCFVYFIYITSLSCQILVGVFIISLHRWKKAAPSSLTWPRSSDWRWRAGRWAPFLRLQAGILTALKPSCLKLRECISEEIELSSPVRRLLAEVTGSQKEAMQKCKGGKGVFWLVPASLSRLTPEYHFHNKGKFSSQRRAGRELQVFASDVIHI